MSATKSKDQIIKELRLRVAELEAELAKFKRGGRKPDGDRPLTVAERVAKHRASKKKSEALTCN